MSENDDANNGVNNADTIVNTNTDTVVPYVNMHQNIPFHSQSILGNKRFVTPNRASITTSINSRQHVVKHPNISQWKTYEKQSINLFPYSTVTTQHCNVEVIDNTNCTTKDIQPNAPTIDLTETNVTLLKPGSIDTLEDNNVSKKHYIMKSGHVSLLNNNNKSIESNIPKYPNQPTTMSNKEYCWLKAQYDCDNGFVSYFEPDNVTDLLFEESCAAEKGSKAVEIIRNKHIDFVSTLNSVDLRQLVVGRVKIDKLRMARQQLYEKLPVSKVLYDCTYDIDSNSEEVLMNKCDGALASSKLPYIDINHDKPSVSYKSDNSQEGVINEIITPIDTINTTSNNVPFLKCPSVDINNDVIDISSDNNNKQDEVIRKAKCSTIIPTCTSTDYVHINNCYPHYYHTWLQSGKDVNIIGEFFNASDWLTHELVEEILSAAPIRPDIQTDLIPNSCVKNKATFERHCARLFPKNRKFVNYRQLDQYLELFLQPWSIKKHRSGFSFICSYGHDKRAKKHSVQH